MQLQFGAVQRNIEGEDLCICVYLIIVVCVDVETNVFISLQWESGQRGDGAER